MPGHPRLRPTKSKTWMPGTRPGMTEGIDRANRFSNIQRLVAAEDAVLVEGEAAVAGQIGLDIGPRGNAVVQIDQAGNPAFEGFHAFGKCVTHAFDDLEQ